MDNANDVSGGSSGGVTNQSRSFPTCGDVSSLRSEDGQCPPPNFLGVKEEPLETQNRELGGDKLVMKTVSSPSIQISSFDVETATTSNRCEKVVIHHFPTPIRPTTPKINNTSTLPRPKTDPVGTKSLLTTNLKCDERKGTFSKNQLLLPKTVSEPVQMNSSVKTQQALSNIPGVQVNLSNNIVVLPPFQPQQFVPHPISVSSAPTAPANSQGHSEEFTPKIEQVFYSGTSVKTDLKGQTVPVVISAETSKVLIRTDEQIIAGNYVAGQNPLKNADSAMNKNLISPNANVSLSPSPNNVNCASPIIGQGLAPIQTSPVSAMLSSPNQFVNTLPVVTSASQVNFPVFPQMPWINSGGISLQVSAPLQFVLPAPAVNVPSAAFTPSTPVLQPFSSVGPMPMGSPISVSVPNPNNNVIINNANNLPISNAGSAPPAVLLSNTNQFGSMTPMPLNNPLCIPNVTPRPLAPYQPAHSVTTAANSVSTALSANSSNKLDVPVSLPIGSFVVQRNEHTGLLTAFNVLPKLKPSTAVSSADIVATEKKAQMQTAVLKLMGSSSTTSPTLIQCQPKTTPTSTTMQASVSVNSGINPSIQCHSTTAPQCTVILKCIDSNSVLTSSIQCNSKTTSSCVTTSSLSLQTVSSISSPPANPLNILRRRGNLPAHNNMMVIRPSVSNSPLLPHQASISSSSTSSHESKMSFRTLNFPQMTKASAPQIGTDLVRPPPQQRGRSARSSSSSQPILMKGKKPFVSSIRPPSTQLVSGQNMYVVVPSQTALNSSSVQMASTSVRPASNPIAQVNQNQSTLAPENSYVLLPISKWKSPTQPIHRRSSGKDAATKNTGDTSQKSQEVCSLLDELRSLNPKSDCVVSDTKGGHAPSLFDQQGTTVTDISKESKSPTPDSISTMKETEKTVVSLSSPQTSAPPALSDSVHLPSLLDELKSMKTEPNKSKESGNAPQSSSSPLDETEKTIVTLSSTQASDLPALSGKSVHIPSLLDELKSMKTHVKQTAEIDESKESKNALQSSSSTMKDPEKTIEILSSIPPVNDLPVLSGKSVNTNASSLFDELKLMKSHIQHVIKTGRSKETDNTPQISSSSLKAIEKTSGVNKDKPVSSLFDKLKTIKAQAKEDRLKSKSSENDMNDECGQQRSKNAIASTLFSQLKHFEGHVQNSQASETNGNEKLKSIPNISSGNEELTPLTGECNQSNPPVKSKDDYVKTLLDNLRSLQAQPQSKEDEKKSNTLDCRAKKKETEKKKPKMKAKDQKSVGKKIVTINKDSGKVKKSGQDLKIILARKVVKTILPRAFLRTLNNELSQSPMVNEDVTKETLRMCIPDYEDLSDKIPETNKTAPQNDKVNSKRTKETLSLLTLKAKKDTSKMGNPEAQVVINGRHSNTEGSASCDVHEGVVKLELTKNIEDAAPRIQDQDENCGDMRRHSLNRMEGNNSPCEMAENNSDEMEDNSPDEMEDDSSDELEIIYTNVKKEKSAEANQDPLTLSFFGDINLLQQALIKCSIPVARVNIPQDEMRDSVRYYQMQQVGLRGDLNEQTQTISLSSGRCKVECGSSSASRKRHRSDSLDRHRERSDNQLKVKIDDNISRLSSESDSDDHFRNMKRQRNSNSDIANKSSIKKETASREEGFFTEEWIPTEVTGDLTVKGFLRKETSDTGSDGEFKRRSSRIRHKPQLDYGLLENGLIVSDEDSQGSHHIENLEVEEDSEQSYPTKVSDGGDTEISHRSEGSHDDEDVDVEGEDNDSWVMPKLERVDEEWMSYQSDKSDGEDESLLSQSLLSQSEQSDMEDDTEQKFIKSEKPEYNERVDEKTGNDDIGSINNVEECESTTVNETDEINKNSDVESPSSSQEALLALCRPLSVRLEKITHLADLTVKVERNHSPSAIHDNASISRVGGTNSKISGKQYERKGESTMKSNAKSIQEPGSKALRVGKSLQALGNLFGSLKTIQSNVGIHEKTSDCFESEQHRLGTVSSPESAMSSPTGTNKPQEIKRNITELPGKGKVSLNSLFSSLKHMNPTQSQSNVGVHKKTPEPVTSSQTVTNKPPEIERNTTEQPGTGKASLSSLFSSLKHMNPTQINERTSDPAMSSPTVTNKPPEIKRNITDQPGKGKESINSLFSSLKRMNTTTTQSNVGVQKKTPDPVTSSQTVTKKPPEIERNTTEQPGTGKVSINSLFSSLKHVNSTQINEKTSDPATSSQTVTNKPPEIKRNITGQPGKGKESINSLFSSLKRMNTTTTQSNVGVQKKTPEPVTSSQTVTNKPPEIERNITEQPGKGKASLGSLISSLKHLKTIQSNVGVHEKISESVKESQSGATKPLKTETNTTEHLGKRKASLGSLISSLKHLKNNVEDIGKTSDGFESKRQRLSVSTPESVTASQTGTTKPPEVERNITDQPGKGKESINSLFSSLKHMNTTTTQSYVRVQKKTPEPVTSSQTVTNKPPEVERNTTEQPGTGKVSINSLFSSLKHMNPTQINEKTSDPATSSPTVTNKPPEIKRNITDQPGKGKVSINSLFSSLKHMNPTQSNVGVHKKTLEPAMSSQIVTNKPPEIERNITEQPGKGKASLGSLISSLKHLKTIQSNVGVHEKISESVKESQSGATKPLKTETNTTQHLGKRKASLGSLISSLKHLKNNVEDIEKTSDGFESKRQRLSVSTPESVTASQTGTTKPPEVERNITEQPGRGKVSINFLFSSLKHITDKLDGDQTLSVCEGTNRDKMRVRQLKREQDECVEDTRQLSPPCGGGKELTPKATSSTPQGRPTSNTQKYSLLREKLAQVTFPRLSTGEVDNKLWFTSAVTSNNSNATKSVSMESNVGKETSRRRVKVIKSQQKITVLNEEVDKILEIRQLADGEDMATIDSNGSLGSAAEEIETIDANGSLGTSSEEIESMDANGSLGSASEEIESIDANGSPGSVSEEMESIDANGSPGSASEEMESIDANGSPGSVSEEMESIDANGSPGCASEEMETIDANGSLGSVSNLESPRVSDADMCSITTHVVNSAVKSTVLEGMPKADHVINDAPETSNVVPDDEQDCHYSSESDSDLFDQQEDTPQGNMKRMQLMMKRHNEVTTYLIRNSTKFTTVEEKDKTIHTCIVCKRFKTNGVFRLSRHLKYTHGLK